LDADEYLTRETATRQLIAAGRDAVAPVLQVMQSGSWEVTTRGIFILQELSLARDEATEQTALTALEQIANSRQTPLSRRAGEALAKLDSLRRQRAETIFTELGALIAEDHQERDLYPGALRTIEIGPPWRGELADLRRLRWLSDIQQVTLVGPQVTDAWIANLRGMENLFLLKIKRAQLTDQAMAYLQEMPSLRCVKLLYLPIGDDGARQLKEARQIVRLKICGTRIGPAGESLLAETFGPDNVDCRRGAFLGIAPNTPGTNWFINSVTENSAAAAAGLQPGDVIVKFGDQPVPDFESLTRLIARNDAGDTVSVEVLRDGRTFVREVTFGEWE
jgi:hypothetical protein